MRPPALSLWIITALFLVGCGGGGSGGPEAPPPGPTGPQLTSVTPGSCYVGETPGLTLTGAGFTADAAGANAVTVGGLDATDLVTVDDTTITCTLPAAVSGPADVTVTNDNGSTTLTAGFAAFRYPPLFAATDTIVSTDTPGDATSFRPEVCCDGAAVYVAFTDARNGSNDIYFNRSLDGGATWLAADVRVCTDGAGVEDSAEPTICCVGSNVYVAWVDKRNGNQDVYVNRSTDRGTTWLPSDVRVDTDAPGDGASDDPKICCVGDTVYLVWRDGRSGAGDIYFSRSVDRGETWQATDTKIDSDPAGLTSAFLPQICCAGSNVYVVWHDGRNPARDIYFNRSTDGGVTWDASDQRLDTSPIGSSDSYQPHICCDGANVYVVWFDYRDADSAIYTNRSIDAGATWQATDTRLDIQAPGGVAAEEAARIACAGNRVYAVWQSERDGEPGSIRFRGSSDGGATWQPTESILETHPTGASQDPVICCAGARVFVAWADGRDGGTFQTDVYLNASDDGGVSWLASDIRVDTDAAGGANSHVVRICCDEAHVYTAWADQRHPPTYEIYVNASQP